MSNGYVPSDKPISAGCLAEVINGVLGAKSPNLGLIVKVLRYVGDDPNFGRIWRCESEYAQRYKDGAKPVPVGTLDFAQDWLRRIDPPPTTNTQTKETEHDKPITVE